MATGPMEQAGLDHGDDLAEHQHRPTMEIVKIAKLEQTCEGSSQIPASILPNFAQTAEIEKQAHIQGDVLPPQSSNPRTESDTKPAPQRKKQKQNISTCEREPAKRLRGLTADEVQVELLAKVTRTIKDIVTVDNIMFVWEQLALLRARDTSDGDHIEGPSQYQMPPPLCKRQHLERLWRNVGTEMTSKRWTKGMRRIRYGSLIVEYKRDKEAFVEWNNQKRFIQAASSGSGEDASPLPHPIEEYLDVFFPETITPYGAVYRQEAKTLFQRLAQRKKPWEMIVRRYGTGLFHLFPTHLLDNYVQRLRISNLKLFLDRIDAELPCLKKDLQGFSNHLSYYIEYGQLPAQKLQIEELSHDEIESKCFTELPLSALFNPNKSPVAMPLNYGPSIKEGSPVEGDLLWPQSLSVYALQDLPQQPVLLWTLSSRDTEEPLTAMTEVHSVPVTISDSFDNAAHTPGHSGREFHAKWDNTSAILQMDEDGFNYLYDHIIASRNSDNPFFVLDELAGKQR